MRVELQVDLRPERRRPVAKPVVDPEARAENKRLAREDRRLRQIALARLIEDRIASGEFASLADIARRCGVSRARVSQVLSLQIKFPKLSWSIIPVVLADESPDSPSNIRPF